jgi:hypothetical protein
MYSTLCTSAAVAQATLVLYKAANKIAATIVKFILLLSKVLLRSATELPMTGTYKAR